jgi:hypothetical protein
MVYNGDANWNQVSCMKPEGEARATIKVHVPQMQMQTAIKCPAKACDRGYDTTKPHVLQMQMQTGINRALILHTNVDSGLGVQQC